VIAAKRLARVIRRDVNQNPRRNCAHHTKNNGAEGQTNLSQSYELETKRKIRKVRSQELYFRDSSLYTTYRELGAWSQQESSEAATTLSSPEAR